jgi:hypothetical protein
MKTYYPDELKDLREELDDLLTLAQTITPPTTEEEVDRNWPKFLEVFAKMLLLSEGAQLKRYDLDPVVAEPVARLCTKIDYPQMRRVRRILSDAEAAFNDFDVNPTEIISMIPMIRGREAHEEDAKRISEIFNRRYRRNPTRNEFLAFRLMEVSAVFEQGEFSLFG